MSRSTFSILPYINRQKVKADGTANILCRITVDGKSAAISTGISCTPQEWNAKKGEVRNARDNGRLASFLAEVKDKYNSLLTANGIITVEMLKAVLKDKDTTGKFLLSFGDTIVEWYRTSKARQTFLHKRTWQKNLRAFVHSLDKDDIAFEDIDENFGEEYKLFLKRDQGRIDSYVNHCLLWLNMLMYKAVDRSIIRFNPIAKIGYEKKAAPKMTHISKADFIKMLSTPMADERTELARRCFIFASLTSLSYIDVKKLYPHHISENSEGRKFIRKEREKTGVEFFVPLHPIAEKILSLYNTTDDSKPVFPLGEKKDIYLDVPGLVPSEKVVYGPLYRNPKRIFGIGLNYVDHAGDIGSAAPKGFPGSFFKQADTLIGPDDEILLPKLKEAQKTTAEAELGIIMGKDCRDISEENWQDAIVGYTTILDMTEESILKGNDYVSGNPRYLTIVKNFPTFFSFGPELVTPDEVPDVNELLVQSVHNGEVHAENVVANMTHRPPRLVSLHSSIQGWYAGDILSTGTPRAFHIQDGDVAECRITGPDGFEMTPLVNPVVDLKKHPEKEV